MVCVTKAITKVNSHSGRILALSRHSLPLAVSPNPPMGRSARREADEDTTTHMERMNEPRKDVQCIAASARCKSPQKHRKERFDRERISYRMSNVGTEGNRAPCLGSSSSFPIPLQGILTLPLRVIRSFSSSRTSRLLAPWFMRSLVVIRTLAPRPVVLVRSEAPVNNSVQCVV